MPNPDAPDSFIHTPLDTTRPATQNPKRRWLRMLLWCAGSLVMLLLLAAAGGVLWLRSAEMAALPVLDGDVHVSGLSAPVVIRRDDHGVPHIEATTQDDLFVAQGYVSAQDRLWQMDAFRRNANGELAELLGPALVPHDRVQRVLLFRKTALRIYANLDVADRTRLDDYARGVNLFIAQHQDSLPAEFKLLAYRPKPWSGEDSIVIGLMMEQTLDTHWDTKLARERIAAKLQNTKLEADLYPVGSWRDHPPTGEVIDWSQPHPAPPGTNDDDDDDNTQARGDSTGHEDLRALHDALLGLPHCDGCTLGSNNWVIAGSHTASGKPLLSNDMHLELTEPNIWFMADLSAPGYHAAGVTLPGMPCVIAGHNEHVAWGITALYADVQDLYLEKLDGKGNFEDLDGSWSPLVEDQEVIKVRGSKNVIVDVQSTTHGPLLKSMLTKETRPIALKWTIYDPALNLIPIYQINVAASAEEFTTALSAWCWPTLNMVYSDDQGHIGFHAVGRVPIRMMRSDKPLPHDLDNLRFEWGDPLLRESSNRGAAGSDWHIPDWQVYIPFDKMPNAFDPPSGFLATANSRVTTEKSPYWLTLEWASPYRSERIYKALQGRDQLKPADMLAVQNDVYSEVDQELGHRFAYAIDHTPGANDRLKKAADLMRSWDGRLTADSAAASIVTQTRKALWPLILEPKLGKDAEDYRWSESAFAEEEIIMHANPDWLPPAYKDWDALLAEAVAKGMEDGKAPADVSQWNYGSWHLLDIEHPLARFLPLIGRVAGTGPQAFSGDTTTVKQADGVHGPSQRFTVDWSNIDDATENITMGESSDPYSPYFRDQWNDWYGGTTFALPFTPAAVAAQTRHTLRLLP
jgi:penicillin amidase